MDPAEMLDTFKVEEGDGLNVATLGDFYGTFFNAVSDFYSRGVFCDLSISARIDGEDDDEGDGPSMRSVRCHALVMATVVPSFKNLLSICEWDANEGAYCVFLPDLDFDSLKGFVDDLYAKLGQQNDDELVLNIGQDLADVLGLSTGVDYQHLAPSSSSSPVFLPVHSVPRTVTGDVDYDAFNKNAFIVNALKAVDEPPEPASGGVKRKAVPSSPRTDAAEFVTTLQSSNRPSFYRFESTVFGLMRNVGAFRATAQPHYATEEVTGDKANVMFTSEGSARQFRMRLPDEPLVALVAVGVRNGVNVATTLAMRTSVEVKNGSWADEKSMVNIVNMIKNVCGTSFGVILRHPRCSEINRAKISRELVNKYKDTYKSLSKLEKTNIASECQLYLKEFDAVARRLSLDHLPQASKKLEFSLVGRLKNSEVMDYAIVCGSGAKQLVIRSFFNFNRQSLTDVRLITILLDTLSCFLRYDNQRSVMNFNILLDTFLSYARRTCQHLAVQELGIQYEDTMTPSTELSATAIMSDDTIFSIHSGKMEGLEKILNLPPKKVRRSEGTSAGGDAAASSPAAGGGGGERLPCTVAGCPDTFVDNRRRNAHVARMHSRSGSDDPDDDPRGCLLCGKVVRSNGELKKHMYSYHKETECKHCGDKFLGMHFLQAHYARVHIQMYECDICGRECRGRSKLKNHKINKHMEEHQKPFVCSICGRGYAEKMKLKSHQMNVHIRTRPFKCRLEGCSADFNELANRNAHERTVHKYDYRKRVTEIQKSVSGVLPGQAPVTTSSIHLI